MRKIDKTKEPDWLRDWKRDFMLQNGREAHYVNDFSAGDKEGGERRKKLRKALIEEQGYLCCYCMGRIRAENDSSHIEHFWPKAHFQEKDMDYNNLFASCQGNYRGEDYCGHKKEDWWDAKMIVPTDSRVEQVFIYTEDGKIHSAPKNSDAQTAQKMIRNLGLDSYHLVRNRRNAIEASEVFDDADYTREDILDMISFYDRKENGKYVPYCKAIIDCLMRML